MNTARIVVLVIALAAGGVAAYLASGYQNAPAPAVPVAEKLPTVEVLVAKNDIQLYDPASDSWTVATAKLPAVRSYTINSTQYVRGRIVMVTGETGHNQPVNTVWSIDPSTLATTALGTFPDARLSAASGVLNDKLYLFGGYKGAIATTAYVGTFVA